VRRGRCPPCKKTFTVLPVWSPPSGHYSYECRRQACDAVAKGKSAPHCRDPTRLPDDSTPRRWARCKFITVLCGLVLSCVHAATAAMHSLDLVAHTATFTVQGFTPALVSSNMTKVNTSVSPTTLQ
jgi:hypothetical protein